MPPRESPEHNLAVKFPDVAAQWHSTKNGDLKPEDVTPRSGKKVWWVCKECGREWDATVCDRTDGTGCPECGKKKQVESLVQNKIVKHGSLADRFQEIAKQWHSTKNGDLKPEDVTPRSGKKVWWVCEKGHEWDATVCDRTDGTGCPECH